MPSNCASRITPSHSCGLHLARRDPLAHAFDENLGAGAGQRFHAGLLQPHEHVARRHVLDVREADDLRNRERMNVDVRVLARARARRASRTIRCRSSGLTPPWIMICVAPWSAAYLTRSSTVIVRHRVAFFVVLGPEERAEGAVHVADVRVVDRRVDDVGDDVASDASACDARARPRRARGGRPR